MRSALRILPLLLLAAACGRCGGARGPGGPAGPDVLLVVLDTTRADRCSAFGYGRPTTPRLEAFAEDAATFTDCHVPAPHTGPSHASLFTGLTPPQHGYTETVRPFLDESAVTLAEVLRDAGWRTAGWTNNPTVTQAQGLTQGFEVYHDLWKERRPYPWAGDTHRRVLAWTAERRAAGERTFVFVNDLEPHTPYEPPEAVARQFLPADVTEDEIRDGRAWKFPVTLGHTLGLVPLGPRKREILSGLYDGEIATLDGALGELFDGLRAAGRLDETLVIVVGDHGEELGEHGLAEHGFGLYRTLLHVPLLVRLPGRFDGGRRSDALTQIEDVFPTVLAACGVETPRDVRPEGLDLAAIEAAARGPSGPPARIARASFGPSPRHAFQATTAFPGCDTTIFRTRWTSAYDGRWHAIERTDGRRELYDTDADPGETVNLADAHPEVFDRLRSRD